MTTLADRTIAALRASHDVLAALVPDLTEEQLRSPSGAAEWSLAQVLSHLGSGAEIGLGNLVAVRDGDPLPGQDANQEVWDRWNAMSPRDQATGFVEHNERLVAAFEALTADQRAALRFDFGFLPEPLPLAAVAGMRLNESTLHSWDARVALDADAAVPEDAAQLLLEHLAGDLGFMTGFTGKADALAKPVTVQVGDGPVGLVIAEKVSVTTAVTDPTATFVGPLDAVLRLIGGRLTPAHTPAGVEVIGDVTLDELRAVFPGY
jgi:uncharacterized protein (TIGR03083 family)